MTHRSPLLTLLGLVIAFGAMFGVNAAASPAPGQVAPGPGYASAAASPSSGSPSSASPSPGGPPAASPSATPSTSSAAPGSNQFPARVVYAGRTRDGAGAVAIAVLGGQAAAYFCDGRRVEAWLRGTVRGDEIRLTGRDGAKLEARLVGDRLRGHVEAADRRHSFVVGVAEKPAGLYRARGSRTTIGWIVLPDGSQVGVERTGGAVSAAPRLDPAAPDVSAGGQKLTAAPVNGDEDL